MRFAVLGANNPEAARLVRDIVRAQPGSECVGFIDNDAAKWGRDFHGYRVLGGRDEVAALAADGVRFCNAITRDAETRRDTTNELLLRGAQLCNLVDPHVSLEDVQLGVGNYVQRGCMLQAGVVLGDNTSVSSSSTVSHETTLGDHSFVAPGCVIAGCVQVGIGVFIGVGVTIMPRLRIGDWAVLGAGSVITRDVPAGAVVAGVPARILRTRGVEPHLEKIP